MKLKDKPKFMSNELFFQLMPDLLETLKENLESIAKHALNPKGVGRYARSHIIVDGVMDTVVYDRAEDRLMFVVDVSTDSAAMSIGLGCTVLSDEDKTHKVEIELPSWLLHNAIK